MTNPVHANFTLREQQRIEVFSDLLSNERRKKLVGCIEDAILINAVDTCGPEKREDLRADAIKLIHHAAIGCFIGRSFLPRDGRYYQKLKEADELTIDVLGELAAGSRIFPSEEVLPRIVLRQTAADKRTASRGQMRALLNYPFLKKLEADKRRLNDEIKLLRMNRPSAKLAKGDVMLTGQRARYCEKIERRQKKIDELTNELEGMKDRAERAAQLVLIGPNHAPEKRHIFILVVHAASIWEELGGRASVQPSTSAGEPASLKDDPRDEARDIHGAADQTDFVRWLHSIFEALDLLSFERPHDSTLRRWLSQARKSQADSNLPNQKS